LLDQLEGAAEHVSRRVNPAVAGKAPLQRILAFAGERGWRRLSLLSSARTTYNRDYFAETAEGHQRPILNVFHRDGETIRHFRASGAFLRANRARAGSDWRPAGPGTGLAGTRTRTRQLVTQHGDNCRSLAQTRRYGWR
jgi:predicted dithiol-disulfide oxidoreductase (DUF899 family)